MITTKQRAYLRGLANGIETLFHVGKAGVTPELLKSIDELVEARELIKINLLDNCPLEIKEAAQIISERTRSDIVQVIGNKIVFYRKSKNNPKIELPSKKKGM